ncbi:MAG: efflux transporter, family, subunit [Firmicutes bacterium]|nr:efflux transporter, family, subunit [Bacillota bacterium]
MVGVKRLQNLAKNKWFYGIATGVIVLGLVCGFLFKTKLASKTVEADVPLVRTSTIGLGMVSANNTYAGEVRGRYESQLAFQVSGKIIKRNVELGSVIHAGDVLMQLDAKDIQQTVNMSSAQVDAAESQLRLAESNLNRYRQLYEDGVVGRAVYEQFQTQYDSAAAAVRQANAQYAQGSYQLDYSCLYADGDGVIAGINAEVGQVIGAGQPVIILVKTGELEVEINIPENKVDEVRKTGQLKVTFWALPGVAVDGKIREISPVADKVARTYKARISLVNPPTEIKLGMTAAVSIADSAKGAVLTIPLTAIYQTQDVPAVWVVNDDVVTLRPVKLGAYANGCVEVFGGLNSGEQIVIAGVHKLHEGQKIQAGGDGQ